MCKKLKYGALLHRNSGVQSIVTVGVIVAITAVIVRIIAAASTIIVAQAVATAWLAMLLTIELVTVVVT